MENEDKLLRGFDDYPRTKALAFEEPDPEQSPVDRLVRPRARPGIGSARQQRERELVRRFEPTSANEQDRHHTLYLNLLVQSAAGGESGRRGSLASAGILDLGAEHVHAIPAGRQPLAELLTQHGPELRELATCLRPDLDAHPREDPQRLDDIYLLRYLLSKRDSEDPRQSDVPKCVEDIRKALAWRREHLQLLREAAAGKPPSALPPGGLASANCFQATSFHNISSFGDPMMIVRSACQNINEIALDLDISRILQKYLCEAAMQFCDAETRRRGYLVKLYIVNDMAGASPNPLVLRKISTVTGETSKRNEFLYPQMLGKYVIVNAPWGFATLFGMVKPLISKASVEKVHIHGALGPDSSRIAAKDMPLPFVGDDAAVLPSFLGGRCECEGGCVGFQIPNTLPPQLPRLGHCAGEPAFVRYRGLSSIRHLPRMRQSAGIPAGSFGAALHGLHSGAALAGAAFHAAARALHVEHGDTVLLRRAHHHGRLDFVTQDTVAASYAANVPEAISSSLKKEGVSVDAQQVYHLGAFAVVRLQVNNLQVTPLLRLRGARKSQGCCFFVCFRGFAEICTSKAVRRKQLERELCDALQQGLPSRLVSESVHVEVLVKTEQEQQKHFLQEVACLEQL